MLSQLLLWMTTSNMVKFSSPNNNEFKRVAGHLMLMTKRAPIKVQENWLTEGSLEAGK
jgi:hypothetical protein